MPLVSYPVIDQRFMGIPYKLGSKNFDGADCVGLAILWLKENGIKYDYEDGEGPISEDWWRKNPRRLIEGVVEHGEIIRFSDIQKFDCLLLTFNKDATFSGGLGVMVDGRHMLTTDERSSSHVRLLDLEIKERCWAGIRLRKTKVGS